MNVDTTIDINKYKPGFAPRKIIASLRRGGNKGVTAYELTKRCGLNSRTARRRISELLDRGVLIHDKVIVDPETGLPVFLYRLSE